MVDREARDRLYGLMVQFLRSEKFDTESMFSGLRTEDTGVTEVRDQFAGYVGDESERGAAVFRSPVVLDWFYRAMLFLLSQQEYGWPPEPRRGAIGCAASAMAPVVGLGTVLGFLVKPGLWWMWLAILVSAFVAYFVAGRVFQQRSESWKGYGDMLAWPFLTSEEYRRAALIGEGRLRRDAPGLFNPGVGPGAGEASQS